MLGSKEMTPEKLLKRRRYQALAFIAAYFFLVVLLLWWSVSLTVSTTIKENSKAVVSQPEVKSQYDTNQEVLSLPPSEPILLRIPSVNLMASFENPLGLNEDKTIQAPESFENVARYRYNPTPGEQGSAVILGHIDSYKGPAVFWNLSDVQVGDRIYVDRQDMSTAIFAVTETEVVKQGNFPTRKVYGFTPYSGIRLITCSGYYDRQTKRYSHNLIVYGVLVELDIPIN